MIRPFPLLLIVLVCSTTGCGRPEPSLEMVLRNHLNRHPHMGPQDVYKLSYQASLGNEHLMTDTSTLRKYLLTEIASVEASANEPLMEALTPDGELVRLNLRPFKAAHGNPEELLWATLETARTFKKSEEQLEKWLETIERYSPEQRWRFSQDSLKAFVQKMRSDGYPSVHHSDAYAAAYRPAYRVILKKFLSMSNHKSATMLCKHN